MRRFSHWEYEDRRTFWGWRREWYAVYVEQPVFRIVIRCEPVIDNPELRRIEQETQRIQALKQQLDAEAAMLESQIRVARKQAELHGLIQLTRQSQAAETPKLLPYQPQVPMRKVR